jgi:hypothetical protein
MSLSRFANPKLRSAAARKRWLATPQGKAWMHAYNRSEKRKAYLARRKERPDVKAKMKAWRDANRARLNFNLKARRYGISPDDLKKLFETRGESCEICQVVFTSSVKERRCVDHCHTTQLVRGVLCARCNAGLANLRDSPVICRAAADYLARARTGI